MVRLIHDGGGRSPVLSPLGILHEDDAALEPRIPRRGGALGRRRPTPTGRACGDDVLRLLRRAGRRLTQLEIVRELARLGRPRTRQTVRGVMQRLLVRGAVRSHGRGCAGGPGYEPVG